MLPLLRQIESISACRDRDILAASVVAGIHESFPTRSVALLRMDSNNATVGELIARADENGLTVANSEGTDAPVTYAIPDQLQFAVAHAEPGCMPINHGSLCCLPLDCGANALSNVLIIELDTPLTQDGTETLERFARFYSNYLRLLDDSEQDTLTQLFNRKTFDESFDRLLADDRRDEPPPEQAERRQGDATPAEKPHWLAVADIDFFKKVNDSYGHLFGDEVLIRFAALMRKSFRKNDRLFRFGGEEFVILLKPSTEANIHRILNRFRTNVESYEFPRVGQVTCSLGFAPIDPRLAPTDILGAADTALYFSKSNGRNQVNSYTELLAQGLIAAPQAIEEHQPDDIDALFG